MWFSKVADARLWRFEAAGKGGACHRDKFVRDGQAAGVLQGRTAAKAAAARASKKNIKKLKKVLDDRYGGLLVSSYRQKCDW
jgi:hypothetical protein